jgi:hypothetical protein
MNKQHFTNKGRFLPEVEKSVYQDCAETPKMKLTSTQSTQEYRHEHVHEILSPYLRIVKCYLLNKYKI